MCLVYFLFLQGCKIVLCLSRNYFYMVGFALCLGVYDLVLVQYICILNRKFYLFGWNCLKEYTEPSCCSRAIKPGAINQILRGQFCPLPPIGAAFWYHRQLPGQRSKACDWSAGERLVWLVGWWSTPGQYTGTAGLIAYRDIRISPG